MDDGSICFLIIESFYEFLVVFVGSCGSSDALQGIENAVCAAFLSAAHQFCVAHVKRQILSSVSHKDKPEVAQKLSEVFPLENK